MKLENQLRDTSTTRTIISGFTRASATFHPPNSRELQQPFLTLAQLNHLYQKWAHHRSRHIDRSGWVPVTFRIALKSKVCQGKVLAAYDESSGP
jgi:hypothetical protein